MDKIKSSYEIAMERAKKLSEEDEMSEEKSKNIEIREELKPLMSKYFREKIDAEELWEKLKDKSDDYLAKAQELIIESLGLRTSDEIFSKRKEGILAIENLKNSPSSSIIEQILSKLNQVENQYQQKREQMEEQFKERMEQQAEMQMKPVQTEDGQTVMKLDSGVDRETQQQMKQQLAQLEEQSEQMFNSLVEDLKNNL
ncbi:MAG TPA: hypothetical protein VJ881_07655 [Halanaerobiales bacterium]|nr:hypothetical protein [Halanaerobiales bacterium]